ncbi:MULTISPECIES: DUF3515 family protein [Streptomyces]|uniref:DUF3515 family protein n=1 Tax=Streptomyces TaxID=1883 RepID=UPI0004CCFCD5|nr:MULTISPECIES: DUF3515 family protein [Streptomyces]KOT66087.1 hypothetical protein ADK43_02030 [Streptomyces rimosus subsp. rimosus]
MARRSRRTLVIAVTATGAALAAGGLIALSAASPPPGRESAPNAGHPACGRAAAHYPSQLLGKERSSTSAEGVAIWGDGAVVLRCGTTPPKPTTDPCFNVNGVDWVLREGASDDGKRVLITYGRAPAIEVTVAEASASAGDGLADLNAAVKEIPQTAHCV